MFGLKKLGKGMLMAALAGALAVGLVAGCGSSASNDNDKTLIVGAETTFPPFEFSNGDKFEGFDLDLSKALAKQMGYKYEFKSMGFDALIPALKTGNINVICSGISATPERAKQVLFTDPYFKESGFVIVVKKDNTDIKDFNDLEGKTVACQIGTIPVDIVKKIPNTKVKELDTYTQMFDDVKGGASQAVVMDKAVAMYYMKQGADKDLKIVGTPKDPEPYVMAVNKNNPELQAKINKALKELKENGEYQKIYDKWFGNEAK